MQFNNSSSFGGAVGTAATLGTNAANVTNIDIASLSKQRYANTYNWSVSLPSSVSAGSNTITLTPCPPGVNATSTLYWIFVGNPAGTWEADQVTGGTCTSGLSSGTVIFTATGSYTSGGSNVIGSASGGIREAVEDAEWKPTNPTGSLQRGYVRVPPAYEANIYGPMYVPYSAVTIDFSGSVEQCWMTSGSCLIAGNATSGGTFQDQLWIAATGRPMAASSGVFIEDNLKNGGTFLKLATRQHSSSAVYFQNYFQADNDQSLHIVDPDLSNGAWEPPCNSTSCGVSFYFPSGGSQSSVVWIDGWNGTLNCASNGIWYQQGNGLHVQNSVIQGYPEFGIISKGTFTPNPNVAVRSGYEEVGSCTNPLYVDGDKKSQVGLLAQTGFATYTGGVGPQGQVPSFAASASGSTWTDVYIVWHSTTYGVSAPMYAGLCKTNGTGTCNVAFPKLGTAGTITYDVLGNNETVNGDPQAPTGTGNFAYATAQSVSGCSSGFPSGMCTITITMGAPSSYTVNSNPAYYPSASYWPGNIVLSTNGDINTITSTAVFTADVLTTPGLIVSELGTQYPSVFSQSISGTQTTNGTWQQSLSCSAANVNVGWCAQLFPYKYASGITTGLIGFPLAASSSSAATELITLGYGNQSALFGSISGKRAAADANDTAIGIDPTTTAVPANWSMALGSPLGVNIYAGHVFDGTNWVAHFGATSNTIVKDTTFSGNVTISGTCTGCTGTFTYPGAGITVSTGTGWGTSLTAPSGTIVGTSDSQTLTNKSIAGSEINSSVVGATYGGTGIDTHLSTGVAQVSSGTWSVSAALANGTTATTQSAADNSTKVATTAYVDAGLALKLNSASGVFSGTPDASSATQFKLPIAAGFATLANGELGYDTTNKNWHGWQNGADALLAIFSGALTNGHCAQISVAAGVTTLIDAGGSCGTSSMVYPTGSGIPVVVSGTSWGTTLTETDGQMLAGVSGAWTKVTALPNGITATTQTGSSNDTKVATDAYVDAHFIGSGTAAMGTAAIASGTCATAVTVSASGVLTTDVVRAGFNGDPTATVGYIPSTSGMLTIVAYPTANNVNFKVCNNGSSSVTPGALTLNWQVTR